MNVLIFMGSPRGTWDTGGQGSRIAEAFRKYAPGWMVRSMAATASYMNYPQDLPFRKKHLDEMYQQADVVHVRNSFELYDMLAAKYGPKPVVAHFHGSRLRGDPNRYVRECRDRGAIALVSTLDLYMLAPDVFRWLPAPYEVDELASLK